MAVDLWAFVQKNILLVGVCVASGIMLLWPIIMRLSSGGRDVSTAEAVQLINRRDAIVIDVREPSEFAEGHIANARHIPVAQLKDRLKDLEKFKRQPIVVVCRSGTRSASACAELKKNGFEEVFPLKGGVLAWQQASLPLQKK